MTEKDRTARDRGLKDIKSLKRHKRKTLTVKARARRSAVSSKSDRCEQRSIEEENC
jgi:hypothetical protein